MPDEIKFTKQQNLLTPSEIKTLSKVFVENYGFDKIRLTGGEPTLRSDFREIILNFREEIYENVNFGLTTNGLLIHRYFDELVECGFRNINSPSA